MSEQVEEEDSANEVVQKIKLMGDARGGLFMLDRELGRRVFTPPHHGWWLKMVMARKKKIDYE